MQAVDTGLPASFSTQLTAGANMIESTSSPAFKDSECTGNDRARSVWQGTVGMDTDASGSTRTAASALPGRGPTTGLPAADVRRTQRGHQYP